MARGFCALVLGSFGLSCGRECHEGWCDVGLSMSHKTPRVLVQGQLVKISFDREQLRGGGKRGDVDGFSMASRKRMIELCLTLDSADVVRNSVFITLTYPEKYPETSATKIHLEAFIKRVYRSFGKLAILWRLEYQKRGAPHYHLIVFGVRFIDKGWVAGAWFEIVGSGDQRHLNAGTRVESLESGRGVVFYVAKYCAKIENNVAGDKTGRVWGVRNKKLLPVCPAFVGEIRQDVVMDLRDVYMRTVRKLPEVDSGFSLYGEMSASLVRAHMTIDEVLRGGAGEG